MADEASRAQETPKAKARGEGLPGWLLPAAGVALVAGIAGAYFLGYISDNRLAEIIAAAFALTLAGIAGKAALETSKSVLRFAIFAYAAATAAMVVYPATVTLLPGEPAFTGELSAPNSSVAIPTAGAWRVLVSAPLKGDRLSYRLKVGETAVDGVLERVYSYRRARRGPAMRVSEAHDVDAYEITVAPGTSVVLDSISGETSGVMTVRGYPILPRWITFAAIALLLVAATFLETRLPSNGALSMTGTAAVAFSILIKTASPAGVMGPVVGSALLGAGGGALGGTILGWLGKRVFKFAIPEPPGKKKKGKDEDE